MKSFIAIPIFLVPFTAASWSFSYGQYQEKHYSNTANLDMDCSQAAGTKGQKISWFRSGNSDCCLRVFSDKKCNNQIGWSCSNWPDHVLGQNMVAIRVTNCVPL